MAACSIVFSVRQAVRYSTVVVESSIDRVIYVNRVYWVHLRAGLSYVVFLRALLVLFASLA